MDIDILAAVESAEEDQANTIFSTIKTCISHDARNIYD